MFEPGVQELSLGAGSVVPTGCVASVRCGQSEMISDDGSSILLLNLHLKMRVQLELITAPARTIVISNALQALKDDVRSNPTQVPSPGGDLAPLRSRYCEDDARS